MTTISTHIPMRGLQSAQALRESCADVNADKARIGMRKDGTLVLYTGRSYLLHPDQTRRASDFLRQLDPLQAESGSRHFRLADLISCLNVRAGSLKHEPTPARLAIAPQSAPRVEADGAGKGFSAAGSRGRVQQDGDMVVKSFKAMDKSAVAHELAMCNSHLKASQRALPEARMQGDTLAMPFIVGSTPTTEEVKGAVGELFRLGFMMGDPSSANFVKTEGGEVVPVDFGLMFKADGRGEVCRSVMSEIVHDYVKGGYRFVPEPLKGDYLAAMREFDQVLGKDSPARNVNVKKLQMAGWFNKTR
ncbi:hypothetical protein HNO92_004163 [Chromobacterium alkanivorans]|uniref:hypothetical protein n=1 Tax=Chromobacterium alkanivorans TaxID=1071719 RepID=UPI002169553F|nr:hypothetical protein [Chromobacterium alkanivorans]MCS3806554.1 hypothetical protein [Chromobacterium alkanivorans]MCS3820892.1 hypothetical protein [Chromobacterium alkanivorans]MCS3875814.1 hypothetical protein [Chromobacterium alkanivorans]